MSPVSNCPPVAVSVWVTESLLVTLTVAPGATLAAIGCEHEVRDRDGEVCVAEPDEPDEPDELGARSGRAGSGPGSAAAQAARSRAAAATRTAAPLLHRLRRATSHRSGRLARGVEGQRRARGGLRPRVLAQHVVEDSDVLHLDRLDRRRQPDGGAALQFRRLGLVGLCRDGLERQGQFGQIP